MIQKICTNFGKCALADSHEDFSLDKSVRNCCPLCDSALSEVINIAEINNMALAKVKTASPRNVNSIFSDLALALVLIAFLCIAAGKDWFKAPQGTHAAEMKILHQNAILRLAGSDIVGDRLGPELAKAFLQAQGATNLQIISGANPKEKIAVGVLPGDTEPSSIEIAAHGSATAFTSLAQETCDIGMISRKINPDEVAKLATLGNMTSAASEHVLGLDGIAVIVNPSNRISELRKDEIRRIFTGDITDWSQVGSFHGLIKLYARDDQSGVFDAFNSMVLAGKPLASTARRFEDSNALSDAVSDDPNGIGFVSLPYVHNAKTIAVSEKGTVALKPTRLTVATEDYPLSRRLYLYTPAIARNKYLQMFLAFALSRQGQEVVAANGFVSQNLQRVTQTVSNTSPEEYKLLTEGAERLSVDFRFQAGKSVQDSKVQADLDRIASLIADEEGAGDRIMLFGFADNNGTPEESQAFSLSQAKIVESQLSQRGIKLAVVRGYGSELPVASNDTSEGRERNRRVEIWIKKKAKQDRAAIGEAGQGIADVNQ
jgi:phosphate transport system substrate-binding protein